jgi:hypothetical protein
MNNTCDVKMVVFTCQEYAWNPAKGWRNAIHCRQHELPTLSPTKAFYSKYVKLEACIAPLKASNLTETIYFTLTKDLTPKMCCLQARSVDGLLLKVGVLLSSAGIDLNLPTH